MWYENLHKSKLTPPNIVFSIVWPILYITLLISLLLYYLHMKKNMWVSLGFLFFMIQFVLNLMWTPIFFYGHQLWLSCLIILLLIIFVVLTMIEFYKADPIASWILIPYLVWIIYAGYLNLYICFRN